MKLPKTVMRYCPYCKKRTEHRVIIEKTRRVRSSLSKSQRRFKELMKGYGGFPRPNPRKSKRWGVKRVKRVDLRFKCKECGRIHAYKKGLRVAKVELV